MKEETSLPSSLLVNPALEADMVIQFKSVNEFKILTELDWMSPENYTVCLGCVYGLRNLDRNILNSTFEGRFLNVIIHVVETLQ